MSWFVIPLFYFYIRYQHFGSYPAKDGQPIVLVDAAKRRRPGFYLYP